MLFVNVFLRVNSVFSCLPVPFKTLSVLSSLSFSSGQGTYVEGMKEEVVLSPAHALSLIASGEGNSI